MGRITFTADEKHEATIERIKAEEDLDSTAGAVRECIERAADLQQRDAELQQREAELQQRIDRLETENERLNAEKRQILAQREEHTELVREVRRDRTLAERKARAGLLTKMKWSLFGMRDEEDSSDDAG